MISALLITLILVLVKLSNADLCRSMISIALPLSKFHIDSSVLLDEYRYYRMLSEILERHLLDEADTDCRLALLVVKLLALPAIDYEQGRDKAVETWREIVELNDSLRHVEFVDWDLEGISRQMGILKTLFFFAHPIDSNSNDSLLQLPTSSSNLPCLGLSFFIYKEFPSFSPGFHPPLDRNDPDLLPAFRSGPLINCMHGMYGTEVVIPQFIKSLGCQTFNPEIADFFLVPSFFKCVDQLGYVDGFGQKDAEASRKLLKEVMEFVKSKPYWSRKNGADHLFIFSWGKFPCALGPTDFAGDAIFLQVENFCEEHRPTFSAWKDVMIPGLVDPWRIAQMRENARPIGIERDILVTFHGRSWLNADSYANVTVRRRFIEGLEGIPGVSVGGFIEDYAEVMGRSIFCLVMRGITPWTIHLYVALFSGCIPVVISDQLVYPFEGIVKFEEFAVRWPESGDPLDLYKHLANMRESEILERQNKIQTVSCWFDYFSKDPECHAMTAIFSELVRKKKMLGILRS